MGRPFRCVLACAAGVLVFALGAGAAHAATWYVATDGDDANTCTTPADPCETIAAAVTKSAAGDTVEVAAGEYPAGASVPQNRVGLTLRGAQAGVDARGREGAAETVVRGMLRVDAPLATVDGFHFLSSGGPPIDRGVDFRGTRPGRNLLNSIVEGWQMGLAVQGGDPATPAEIRGNVFRDNGGADPQGAIYVAQAFSDATIADNEFEGNLRNIMLTSRNPKTDIVIEGNTAVDGNDFVMSFFSEGLIVRDNETDGVATPVSIQANTVDALVTGNVLRNGSGNGVFVGTRTAFGLVDPLSSGLHVEGNVVSGFSGAALRVSGNGHDGGPVFTANRAPGNAQSVNNQDVMLTVDAQANWWGCNDGPAGCGQALIGNVDASPWVVLGVSADPSQVQTNEDSEVTADLLTMSDGSPSPAALPDGGEVAFATDLGQVSPSAATLDGLSASTTFSSPDPGTATVSATLDGETATTEIVVDAPPAPAPSCLLINVQIRVPLLGLRTIQICI